MFPPTNPYSQVRALIHVALTLGTFPPSVEARVRASIDEEMMPARAREEAARFAELVRSGAVTAPRLKLTWPPDFSKPRHRTEGRPKCPGNRTFRNVI